MASTKRKAQLTLRRGSAAVKRSLQLDTVSKTTEDDLLSWSDKEDIERQVFRQIDTLKVQEVIKNAANMIYKRDLVVTFGAFGTNEQQEEFERGKAEHGSICHHCGESGHWENTCTLTCNKKRCQKHGGQCAKGWYLGEQIKKFGTKHQGETYLQIALGNPEYFRWVMRQWEPALDIYDFQLWGKERNVLYKCPSDFWEELDTPHITLEAPILLNLGKKMAVKKQHMYQKEFHRQLVERITVLNTKMLTKTKQVDSVNNSTTLIAALEEEDENSCDTDQESPLYCNETL